MRLRSILSVLALAIPFSLGAQDTTAIKGYTRRDSLDAQAAYNASRSSTVRSAARRIQARKDSIERAMRPSIVVPPPPPAPSVHAIAITPSSGAIGVGGSVQLSGRAYDDAGATVSVPINWASSASAVASVDATGLVKGLSAGSALITASTPCCTAASRYVTVTVAAQPPPPPPPDTTTPPPSTIGFDGVAELPRLTPARANPSCSTTVSVTAGMDLQQAINMAQPGACLMLAAGATFVGQFTLPSKGVNSQWITIATQAALPAAGTRMTPSAAATLKLAKILTDRYAAAITVAQGANHYRLRGLEIATTTAAQATGINMLVDIRNGDARFSASTAPSYIQLEQSYIHGTPTLDLRRCIWQDGYLSSVIDSWVADCHSNNTDSQAGLHLSGARGVLWENNHLEAGHEIFLSGGGDPPDSTLQPSDITVRRNHIIRPASWKGVWQAKNLVETKDLRRWLFEGNVLENSWPDAQAGFCLVLKSENQDGTAPFTTSSDFTIRYNLVRSCASGFNISARGSNSTPAIPASRYSIHDNVIDTVAKYGGDGIAMQSLGDVVQIEYRRNTFLNGLQGYYSNQAISFDGAPSVKSVWDGNIMGHGSYGVKGAGTGDGITTLSAFAPGGIFTQNAIVGGCGQYPAGNTCPATVPTPTATTGANMTLVAQLTNGVVVNDMLSLRRSVARRSQLKYAIPVTKPSCQRALAKCADLPMGLR